MADTRIFSSPRPTRQQPSWKGQGKGAFVVLQMQRAPPELPNQGREGTQTDFGLPAQLLLRAPIQAVPGDSLPPVLFPKPTQGPSSPVNRVRPTNRTHGSIPAGLQHRVREPQGRPAFWETRAAEVEPGGQREQGQAGATRPQERNIPRLSPVWQGDFSSVALRRYSFFWRTRTWICSRWY